MGILTGIKLADVNISLCMGKLLKPRSELVKYLIPTICRIQLVQGQISTRLA